MTDATQIACFQPTIVSLSVEGDRPSERAASRSPRVDIAGNTARSSSKAGIRLIGMAIRLFGIGRVIKALISPHVGQSDD